MAETFIIEICLANVTASVPSLLLSTAFAASLVLSTARLAILPLSTARLAIFELSTARLAILPVEIPRFARADPATELEGRETAPLTVRPFPAVMLPPELMFPLAEILPVAPTDPAEST